MTATSTVPRFLLPQTSWKATMLPYRAFIRPALHTKSSLPHPSRSLSSQVLHSRQPSHILTSILAARPTPFYHSSGRTLAAIRAFSTTQCLARDHHFDTLKFVQRLKDEGFSEEQSKAMMLVLSDVIEESIQNLTRTMVLREGVLLPYTSPPLPRFTQPCTPFLLAAVPSPRVLTLNAVL